MNFLQSKETVQSWLCKMKNPQTCTESVADPIWSSFSHIFANERPWLFSHKYGPVWTWWCLHHFRTCFISFAGTVHRTEPKDSGPIRFRFQCERERWKDQQMSSDLKYLKCENWRCVNIRFLLFIVMRYIKYYYLNYRLNRSFRSAEDAKIRIPMRDGCRCALRQPTMALWNGFALFQALDRWAIRGFTDLPRWWCTVPETNGARIRRYVVNFTMYIKTPGKYMDVS